MLIFLLTAGLIKPLFKAKYLNRWGSIESTFVADSRFLKEHWPHPQWQPLWYTGTRFDYIYPPALRYGSAVISLMFGYIPVKAYHVYTAFFYCIGIAGVYFLIRIGSHSRGAAWLGALATATMSPSFLVLEDMRRDSGRLVPVRLGVLTKYGEGPHMTALALIPIALAFTWLALEKRRAGYLVAAALFSALVVSNNFYGGTALAIFYPLLIWSHWITRGTRGDLARALAIPLLAYGLTAFWLTPSYLRITVANLQYVSEKGNVWSIWLALALAAVYAALTWKFALGREDRAWPVFVAGSCAFFTLNVLGNRFFNFRISGEPTRLIPELDLVWIMLAAAVLAWVWRRRRWWWKAAAAAYVVTAFWTTLPWVRRAWELYPLSEYQNRIEYRVTDWLWKNMPDARVYPSGSVRFWFDTWHDLAQLGGGSEQGLLNGTVQLAQWEILGGPEAGPGILWMQCLGVDAVYVSDKRSEEPYKDIMNPGKFNGVLPVIFDDGRGNFLYRVPRRYAVRARVVETAKLAAARAPEHNVDVDALQQYAGMIENGPDSQPLLERQGSDAMRIRATLSAGQSLIVQEAWDPAWQAWSAGRQLSVRKDPMGLMAIEAPAGVHDIALAFVTPMENRIGRMVTLLTLLLLVALLFVKHPRGVKA